MEEELKSKQIVDGLVAAGFINPESREQAQAVVTDTLRKPIQIIRLEVADVLSGATSASSRVETDDSKLLEKAFQEGRSVIDAFHSKNATQGRSNRGGSYKLVDAREYGQARQALFLSVPNKEHAFGNDIMMATHNSGIKAATALHQLNYTIGRYLPGSQNSQEKAYGIYFHVTELKGETVREEQYQQPDGDRNGGVFTGCIVLPESTAKEIYSQVKQHPALLWKLFRTFDPNVMAEQERVMPETIDQIFVMPEGGNDDAYVGSRVGSKTMNDKYVLELADRKSIT